MKEQIQRFNPRQTMSRPDFEIFHYQDPHSPPVAVHHHDFYEVYFFLSGRVEYRVEGRIYTLQPGDVLLINPLELHQLIPKVDGGAYERIVLWVEKSYLEQLSTQRESLTRCFDNARPGHSNRLRPTAAQRTELLNRMDELVRESHGTDYGSELCARGILLQLMVELNRLAERAGKREETAEEVSPLVTEVLAYIGEHYSEPLSLERLARRFFVSKYHLSHEFSRVVGTSVYRYVTLKRLLIAKQLLSGGVSPGVVYSNCGFGDYSNFYRAFKAQYGISPREYAEV